MLALESIGKISVDTILSSSAELSDVLIGVRFADSSDSPVKWSTFALNAAICSLKCMRNAENSANVNENNVSN